MLFSCFGVKYSFSLLLIKVCPITIIKCNRNHYMITCNNILNMFRAINMTSIFISLSHNIFRTISHGHITIRQKRNWNRSRRKNNKHKVRRKIRSRCTRNNNTNIWINKKIGCHIHQSFGKYTGWTHVCWTLLEKNPIKGYLKNQKIE